MKKILYICLGLSVVVSIILSKLYSASVVRFVNEVEEADSKKVKEKPSTLISNLLTSSKEEEEDEEEIRSTDNEEEYMDTLIKGEERVIVKVNPTYVDAIVVGNQKIKKNIPVQFLIPENIEVKDKYIPANTLFYAMPQIDGDDVSLKVNTIQTARGLVLVSLHALQSDLKDVLSENSDSLMILNDGDTILFDY